ncbi:MAG: hypothetical protein WAK57_14870 [Desulfobacterales bacterium]|jgi:hypothetical protein
MNGTYALKPYEGIDGGMLILWMSHHRVIAEFIERHKLAPVSQEHLFRMPMRVSGPVAESAELTLKPYPFPGGIRIPHLHFKKELYLLDREQWKEFTGNTIKGFREKLEHAHDVTFEQLMEISEAVSTLT